MTDEPLVSIVIPAKNEQEHVSDMLASLEEQRYARFEVFFVDDASTDQTPKIIQSYQDKSRFPLTLINHQTSMGAAKARDDGFRRATGDYVVFLDADDRLAPDFIKNALSHFDEDVVGVAPRMRYTRDTWVERGVVAIISPGVESIPMPHIWRAEDLRTIGGWDATLGRGQDWDLHERVKDYCRIQGKRVEYCSDCVINTHVVHTLNELFQQHRWYGRGTYSFFRKHRKLRYATTFGKLGYPLIYLGPFSAVMLPHPYGLLALMISLPNIAVEFLRVGRGMRNEGVYGLATILLDGVKWLSFTFGLIEFALTKKKDRE